MICKPKSRPAASAGRIRALPRSASLRLAYRFASWNNGSILVNRFRSRDAQSRPEAGAPPDLQSGAVSGCACGGPFRHHHWPGDFSTWSTVTGWSSLGTSARKKAFSKSVPVAVQTPTLEFV